jgi:hypothetical protein
VGQSLTCLLLQVGRETECMVSFTQAASDRTEAPLRGRSTGNAVKEKSVAELIEEVTEEGLRLPRRLLEQWGYAPGRRMRISASASGVFIRPAEAEQEDIESLALRYLVSEAGDMAGIRRPEHQGNRWRVQVVLRPDGQLIGELYYSLDGTLLAAESSSPAQLIEAADAA